MEASFITDSLKVLTSDKGHYVGRIIIGEDATESKIEVKSDYFATLGEAERALDRLIFAERQNQLIASRNL